MIFPGNEKQTRCPKSVQRAVFRFLKRPRSKKADEKGELRSFSGDQPQNQHVNRIKSVAEILKRPVMEPLPSFVEPDRDQRQKGKPLLAQLEAVPEKGKWEHLPAQKLHIDPVEGSDLPQQIPPLPSPEKVKDKYGQHSGAVIVHHAEGT